MKNAFEKVVNAWHTRKIRVENTFFNVWKIRFSRVESAWQTRFHAWNMRGVRVKNERYGFKNLVVPRSSFKTLVTFKTFINKRRFKRIVFNAYSTRLQPFSNAFFTR